jgi:uncharacterized protein (TIGR02145 family)
MASSTGWYSSSSKGTIGNDDYPEKQNASGFTALPGGYRSYFSGTFGNLGEYGYWWSSTEFDSSLAYCQCLGYSFRGLNLGSYEDYYDDDNFIEKECGFSVRLVRD